MAGTAGARTRLKKPVLLAAMLAPAFALATAGAQPEADARRLPPEQRPLGLPYRERGGGGDEEKAAIPGAEAARALGPLVLVIGCIVAGAWMFKVAATKRGGLTMAMGPGGRAPSGVVEVLARYPLGRGHVLVLFKIGPRILIASQTYGRGGGMHTLSEIADPEEVAALVMKTRDADGKSSTVDFHRTLERTHGAPPPDRSDRRRVIASESGDRVELLRDPPPRQPTPGRFHAGNREAPKPEVDPVEALRERLAAMRSAEGA